MATGCRLSKKFTRWGPDIQEPEDHDDRAQDTDYRVTGTSKWQSGHPITVVYGERKARQHQQREV